jgi:hypothetical protein
MKTNKIAHTFVLTTILRAERTKWDEAKKAYKSTKREYEQLLKQAHKDAQPALASSADHK